MIPVFPKFKKLEITDKKSIESFTKQYPPYSDYNFVSLWSWDTEKKTEISQLNDNLIVKFQDYQDKNLFFYSFIGTNSVHQTILILLAQAKKDFLCSQLKLIPEIVVHNLRKSKQYSIKENRDNFDYILSVKEIIKVKDRKFKKKRNMIRRFIRNHRQKTTVRLLDIANKKTQKEIESLFCRWEKSRGKNRKDTKEEFKSIQKLLSNVSHFDLCVTGLFIKDRLIAASIDEVVYDNYAITHYEKADAGYKGVFEYLRQQSAIHLDESSCKYINYEQDLGKRGIRKAKILHRPIHFLKKYIISAE